VHFHEVGAVDAIVDITGTAIGLHRLGVTRITFAAPAWRHGTVGTAHGGCSRAGDARAAPRRAVMPAGIRGG
jgi:uncharacterized protein (DUF111 family)